MDLLNQEAAVHGNKDQEQVEDLLSPLNIHYLSKSVSDYEEYVDYMPYHELAYQLEHDDLNLKLMMNALNFSFL
jgi:hypothetical protein